MWSKFFQGAKSGLKNIQGAKLCLKNIQGAKSGLKNNQGVISGLKNIQEAKSGLKNIQGVVSGLKTIRKLPFEMPTQQYANNKQAKKIYTDEDYAQYSRDKMKCCMNGNEQFSVEESRGSKIDVPDLGISIDKLTLPGYLAESTETLLLSDRTIQSISHPVRASRPPVLDDQFIQDMEPKIAASFAGEIRDKVQPIVMLVNDNDEVKGHVFYDNWFKAQLGVTDLQIDLFNLYDRSKLVVVFLSKTYHKKHWCQLEWSSIYRRRWYMNKNTLMLIKMEDFDLKALGLSEGDGYIDATILKNEEVASLILKRFKLLIEDEKNHVDVPLQYNKTVLAHSSFLMFRMK